MNATRKTWFAGILLTIVMSVAPASASAGGKATTDRSVPATSGGARLTLSVSRSTFPRNALAIVTVRLRNVSRSSLGLLVAPSVTVTNGRGQSVYSGSQMSLNEAFPNFSVRRPMGGGGGSPAPLLLKPGQERTYRTFVILRGATLRASASISHARSGNLLVPAHAIIVTSPALHVRLGRSDPPRINLKRLAQRESAMLPKTDSHRRGSPWYIELARCGTSSTGSLAWSKVEIAAGNEFQIPAPCYGNPSAWRVAAGWVGQSLAFIRYR